MNLYVYIDILYICSEPAAAKSDSHHAFTGTNELPYDVFSLWPSAQCSAILNVVHENDFKKSNLLESVELRRCIQLFRYLEFNKIKTLPAGIFDQLENLQIL
jgi:hypothetical protein